MKRLTLKDENGWYLTGDGIYSDWGVPEKFRGEDIDHLAAIEDILGDEYDLGDLKCNLKDLQKALWCKKVVEDAFSDDPSATERLRNLWFADQKGHCVVFDEYYPVVSEYYRDEDGRYIRESSGVISEAEYKKAMGDWLK